MPPIETERKFLIKFPDTALLCESKNCKIKKIEQTYLLAQNGITRRVRKIECNNKTEYIFTEKHRISSLSCFENEKNIAESEYKELLRSADSSRKTVFKTRYAFQYEKHTVEIDIYDFWKNVAILEIELNDEKEIFEIPPFISVIKEVTDDKRFKNVNLARWHDFDPFSSPNICN